MYPKFKFEMDLPNEATGKLLHGKLYLKDENTNIVLRATSGLPFHQYHGSWRTPRAGCIPPTQVLNRMWEVSTNRMWMPDVKGVEGSFWGISPFTINMGGTTRGDFGIHFDANVPGSAGCIVVDIQDHFDKFKAIMAEYHQMRIKSISLEVVYT